jgi:hypothetical protein
LSLDSFLVADGDGTGRWLSAAIVASAMAAVYGVSLYRTVLTRARVGAATFPPERAARSSPGHPATTSGPRPSSHNGTESGR